MKKLFYKGQIYHVFNRSIAHFKIFKYMDEFTRFLMLFEYYNEDPPISYSSFNKKRQRFYPVGLMHQQEPQIVKILSYCIMPDHYHMVIKTMRDNGEVIKYFSRVENAYAMYFNKKTERHGHLWGSSFKFVRVLSDQQLLYLTKYVHRNPLKARLVDDLRKWQFSSLNDYLNANVLKNLEEISIDNPKMYLEFIGADKDLDKELFQLDAEGLLIE